MKARHTIVGTVMLKMTRAEAHVLIWGGKIDQRNKVEQNMREALVVSEDSVSLKDYEEIIEEITQL